MKTETLPAHVAKTCDAGFTDSEVIDLGINSNDYLTRRLALIASDLERERDPLTDFSDIFTEWTPESLEAALEELYDWQDVAEDCGSDRAEVRRMILSLRAVAVTDSDSLSRFLVDNAAMEETLEEHGLLDEALETARRDYP